MICQKAYLDESRLQCYDEICENKMKGPVSGMENLILFLNSFFSYLLLMAIIVVIAGVAVFIGIKMRKNKNEKAKQAEESLE